MKSETKEALPVTCDKHFSDSAGLNYDKLTSSTLLSVTVTLQFFSALTLEYTACFF